MTRITEAFLHWIQAQDDIAIITHLHPDGDALGSSIALCLALKSLGKRVFVCCQDSAPDFLSMLPLQGNLYQPEALPFEPRAILCVDCAAASRFGRAAALIAPEHPLACLDHHETNDLTCDISLIDPKAAASGELVAELIDALNIEWTADIALCLYAAISTDTGNFAFSCTTPAALRAVARCLETGLDIDSMNYELFRKRTMGRTRLLGAALTGIEYLMHGRLALIRIRRSDFDACGAVDADTESIVNYGVNTAGVEVAIMAVEQKSGAVKFSLRSRGAVNVAQTLLPLGGGGHDRAAGVTLMLPFEEAVAQVVEAAQNALTRTGEAE